MPKDNKKPVRQPKDHGSNYNAFGHDPDGKIAYLAALFYGPGWVPRVTPKQFEGPPALPRFGPPALYQESCLPPRFKPRMHRNYYKMEAAFEEAKKVAPGEESEFLSPPKEFDPHVFDAFKFGRNFINRELFYQESY